MADLLRLMDEDQSKQSSIHRQIKVLKGEISELSKRNYELEKDVHFFDQRIGLLINHKKAVEELLDSFSEAERKYEGGKKDGEPKEKYGNLFFLLQTEPYYLAQLTRIVSLSEVDILLQPVLFSLYGNQYEAREEYLLLCMFELALKYEVDESETFNSLLRANTAITRMMTTYTRRGPGQEYLKSTLGRVLNEVVSEHDLVLEINPVKVFTQIYGLSSGSSGQLTMEQAMDDTGVQAKISERSRKLIDIATQFVAAIKNSLEHVPYGIRLLCCTIVSLVKEKFPQASTSQMTSLIGGFFLLRFLNPAIVTPNAFMLVSQQPSPCVKRNLMLVAKLLQSMANKHYVSSHFKEEYMQTLEPFAMEHVDELHNFLLKLSRLSGISDFYENVELEQYLSLSKDIKISITPNEMYRIHELILKYKEELALTEDDPLHILLDELGPPGKQLSYSMNTNISLTLTNRWEHTKVLRTDSVELSLNKKFCECSITEQCRTLFVKLLTMDTTLMEEKSLMDVIIRARKEDKGDMSRIAGYIVSKYKHFVEFKSLLTANADFYEEVKQEVKQKLEDFSKHEAMLKNLQDVHETLCKQERFLTDQLAVYKEYLIAVRMKAASPSSKKTSAGLPSVERTTDPWSFTYIQLEKEGVIVQRHEIPERRKIDLTVTLASSEPGVYQVVIFSKGEPNPVYEIHLNLEELLELQHQQKVVLRLNEMILLDVRRTLTLLHKNFASSVQPVSFVEAKLNSHSWSPMFEVVQDQSPRSWRKDRKTTSRSEKNNTDGRVLLVPCAESLFFFFHFSEGCVVSREITLLCYCSNSVN